MKGTKWRASIQSEKLFSNGINVYGGWAIVLGALVVAIIVHFTYLAVMYNDKREGHGHGMLLADVTTILIIVGIIFAHWISWFEDEKTSKSSTLL